MSGCVGDNELIRMLGRELDPHERAALLQHLELCAHCQSRYRATQATWALLGKWEVEPGELDLTARVLASAQRRPAHRSWLPLAASIALAAGLGVSAGLLRSHESSGLPQGPRTVSPERLVQALGLDALGQDSIALDDVLTAPEGSGEQEEPNT